MKNRIIKIHNPDLVKKIVDSAWSVTISTSEPGRILTSTRFDKEPTFSCCTAKDKWYTICYWFRKLTHWHEDHTPGYIMCGESGCKKIFLKQDGYGMRGDITKTKDNTGLRFLKS